VVDLFDAMGQPYIAHRSSCSVSMGFGHRIALCEIDTFGKRAY
jgi:hypothetical protein